MHLSQLPLIFIFKIYICISLVFILASVTYAQRGRARPRLCSTIAIPNAVVRFKHNYKIMRIICAQGFTLQGSNMVGCENGKWNGVIPICAKEGCKKLVSPKNGAVTSGRLVVSLYCNEKFRVAGGRTTFCNGTHWDRPLGECRETRNTTELTCDFETDDLCGWSHEESHNFDWKRVMAAHLFQQLRTGPQHDHTTLTANSGHYMLLESFDKPPNSIARLLSPIYSRNVTRTRACFRFFYFMYGATVGTLNVYVKPVSVDIDEMAQDSRFQYFSLSGNQENIWRQANFTIKQMSEDFQIIIEGTAGSNHLSDIAIDDVHLMTDSECNTEATMATVQAIENTENAIYDIQSCESRCDEVFSSGQELKKLNGRFIKTCDCHPDCELNATCCPNYRQICLFGNFESTTLFIDSKTAESPSSLTTIQLITTQQSYSLKDTFSYTPTLETVNRISTRPQPTVTFTPRTTEKKSILFETTTQRNALSFSSPQSARTTRNTNFNYNEKVTESTTDFMSTQRVKTAVKYENRTSTNIFFKFKEKAITWETDQKSNNEGVQLPWLLLTITGLLIIIIAITGTRTGFYRHLGRVRLHSRPQRSNGNYSDTTTLANNMEYDIIVEKGA